MTYRELFTKCLHMTDEQLVQDVTVHLSQDDEYFKVDHLELTNSNEEDRLDDGHPILIVLQSKTESEAL